MSVHPSGRRQRTLILAVALCAPAALHAEGSAGYRGVFTGSLDGRPSMRGLWTFERGEWGLPVAADFPRIDHLAADLAIANFVSALNDANAR